MTVAIGTGGNYVTVLSESNGQFKILGRPVFSPPNLPLLGDANDIMFVDLSQYAIGIRRGFETRKIEHSWMDKRPDELSGACAFRRPGHLERGDHPAQRRHLVVVRRLGRACINIQSMGGAGLRPPFIDKEDAKHGFHF